ncbi:MAG: Rieske 2Fe-2S domain-containing protein [Saprospiraceae bacterium]|nr:Rieske 2Fe-2S domain-containing protein [Saprospiraceae bacterium]
MFRKVLKWHLLLPLEELNNWPPNGLKRASIKGKALCIAKRQNQYFALANKCPHAGADLSTGWLNTKEEIVCPLHRFTFHCGSGENTSGHGFYLENYPTELRSDGLWLGLHQWAWPWDQSS